MFAIATSDDGLNCLWNKAFQQSKPKSSTHTHTIQKVYKTMIPRAHHISNNHQVCSREIWWHNGKNPKPSHKLFTTPIHVYIGECQTIQHAPSIFYKCVHVCCLYFVVIIHHMLKELLQTILRLRFTIFMKYKLCLISLCGCRRWI